jgi:hypothetical protein
MRTFKVCKKTSFRIYMLAVAPIMVFAIMGVGISSAAAAEPWWHLNSGSTPANIAPEGKGKIVLTAANLGDADANGTVTPVRITDTLPPGLKATGIAAEAGKGRSTEHPVGSCSLTPVPTCEYTEVLAPYGQIQVFINVEAEPGAHSGEVNQASVSGGGALGVSVARAITVSKTPTPYGVEDYETTPEEEGGATDTQAGSHPFQLTTTLDLNTILVKNLNQQAAAGESFIVPAALAKDLNFKLPPGLIGNPKPFPQCPENRFLHRGEVGDVIDECPPDTAVGVASVTIFVPDAPTSSLPFVVPLFNLVPEVGEPARFGFYYNDVPVFLDTHLRTGGDYGVTVSGSNITQEVGFIANRVTFWGVPGDPRHDSSRGWSCIDDGAYKYEAEEDGLPGCTPSTEQHPPPLLSLPTSCTGPLETTVETDSWSQEGMFQSFPQNPGNPLPALDGCNRLPFGPTISLVPDGQAGSTPTGLAVTVHVPQSVSLDGEGLSEADVKNTTVVLPAGVAINPAGADGLLSCSEEQIALRSPEPPSCPEGSKIGLVKIHTPLLPNDLEGAAYLGAQEANPFGSLVAIYVYVEDPVSGSRVKLAGEVAPNPLTGQLVSTFKNTPQLPFETFELHFFGGERAPLDTPASCGAYTTTASVEPWSETGEVDSNSTFDVTSAPNGAPCQDPLPFKPSLTAGTTNINAGGFSPFTMTMSREDGSQHLQAIQLKMPPGLSGLLSGVELCPEPQADEGTCAANSLIGETTVSVGVGGDPFSVKGGRVYITGPYEGAPFGLSIVNPAKAGPYDLEDTKINKPACDCVLVRAKIEVNPLTAALTITSDNSGPYKIPTILEGIPLQIQHVNVTINRPDFTFNPTNCNKTEISGTLDSTEGSTQALSVPFQATNCAVLAFKPGFAVSTSGRTSRASGASLSVKLTYPTDSLGKDANIAKVKVDLPKQLPSRLTTLQKACTAATFEANPANCPTDSRVGQAKAITPLIPVPLEGPAYFVSHGGAKFPELIVVLQGYGVTIDLHGETFISKAGITSSTFATIPDAPVGSFELTLPEGPDSALAANGNLCKSKLTMPTAFVAQNGAEIHESTKISVTGCPKNKKAKKSSKHHKTKTHGKKK